MTIIVAVLVIIGAAFLFRSQELLQSEKPAADITVIDQIDTGSDFETLSQLSCEIAGGTWNACGSACRTNPEGICIEVCVEYCECQEDTQCPDSLKCLDYVDGVGVCALQEL